MKMSLCDVGRPLAERAHATLVTSCMCVIRAWEGGKARAKRCGVVISDISVRGSGFHVHAELEFEYE